ncbi:Smr/MutS family protein [Chitinibacter fontanus]|uniref:Smr/MutS family protein n=1 Tax=Chitinibacter fontanus TaxID=1737446 RepID=A0A7D5Z9S6_9NEIS|nr:Smr/MutS family protein [Chitinibacter fontanus]QLI83063.1 Smr/MutS family protein [Chitinibacter fontanus]
MDKKTLQQLKQLRKSLRQDAVAAKKPRVQLVVPSDKELFLRAMADVKPLTIQQFAHPPQPVSPWPRQQRIEDGSVYADMTDFWPWDELAEGEQLHFSRPGMRLEQLKRLKKGEFAIDGELDLHGETVDSARQQVAHFLVQSQARKYRCVRIIHGKGLSSKDGFPILKLKLKNWLVQRDEVLAFVQAKPSQGCAGAVLVLLRVDRGRR